MVAWDDQARHGDRPKSNENVDIPLSSSDDAIGPDSAADIRSLTRKMSTPRSPRTRTNQGVVAFALAWYEHPSDSPASFSLCKDYSGEYFREAASLWILLLLFRCS